MYIIDIRLRKGNEVPQTYNSETVRLSKDLIKEILEAKTKFEIKNQMEISMTEFLGSVVRKGLKSVSPK